MTKTKDTCTGHKHSHIKLSDKCENAKLDCRDTAPKHNSF